MAVENIVVAPELKPALATATATLQITTAIIDLLSENANSPTTIALQAAVAKQQKLLLAYLSRLRLQTRRAAYLARSTKSETTEARKQVDGLLLQLQNLYYEQRHLLGEISSCEEYAHAYRELPLIDESEFEEIFPDAEGMEEGEMMERRIGFEGEERRRLEEERLGLVRRKEELLRENGRRKERLKEVDGKVEGWIDGSRGLEEELAKEL